MAEQLDITGERPKFYQPTESERAKKMITPLGAAVVEALPDRKAVSRIKKRFRVNRECPISAIFSEDQVREFYAEEGEQIKPIIPTVAEISKQPPSADELYVCPCVSAEFSQCGTKQCWFTLDQIGC